MICNRLKLFASQDSFGVSGGLLSSQMRRWFWRRGPFPIAKNARSQSKEGCIAVRNQLDQAPACFTLGQMIGQRQQLR